MIVFHVISARGHAAMGGSHSHRSERGLPAHSPILLWIAVVACGRWIGFTMQGPWR